MKNKYKEKTKNANLALKVVAVFAIIIGVFFVVFVLMGTPQSSHAIQQVQGAAITNISGDPYELKDGSYIVKDENKALFANSLLEDGWELLQVAGDCYTFERDGHIIEYKETSYIFNCKIYKLNG